MQRVTHNADACTREIPENTLTVEYAHGQACRMNFRITLGWLGSWLTLLALSVFVTEGMHYAAPDADTGAMQASLALSVSWLAILLMPLGFENRVRPQLVIIWAVLAAAGYLLLSLLMAHLNPGRGGVHLAGGVLVLVLLMSALQTLIRGFTSSPCAGLTLVSLIVGAFLAAPLYLGVVAEQFSDRVLVANIIVAASPLSYFAGIVEFDYLRTTWFYQHTSFGGLRFEYPDAGLITAVYLVIAMAMLVLSAHHNALKNVRKV
jgi:hypothetical protein